MVAAVSKIRPCMARFLALRQNSTRTDRPIMYDPCTAEFLEMDRNKTRNPPKQLVLFVLRRFEAGDRT
jgi:hypothetical protein